MNYAERDAIAAVTNIDNALLQLEIFKEKRLAVIAHIDSIIACIEDGGVEQQDYWRHVFFTDLRLHLTNLNSAKE